MRCGVGNARSQDLDKSAFLAALVAFLEKNLEAVQLQEGRAVAARAVEEGVASWEAIDNLLERHPGLLREVRAGLSQLSWH